MEDYTEYNAALVVGAVLTVIVLLINIRPFFFDSPTESFAADCVASGGEVNDVAFRYNSYICDKADGTSVEYILEFGF